MLSQPPWGSTLAPTFALGAAQVLAAWPTVRAVTGLAAVQPVLARLSLQTVTRATLVPYL